MVAAVGLGLSTVEGSSELPAREMVDEGEECISNLNGSAAVPRPRAAQLSLKQLAKILGGGEDRTELRVGHEPEGSCEEDEEIAQLHVRALERGILVRAVL